MELDSFGLATSAMKDDTVAFSLMGIGVAACLMMSLVCYRALWRKDASATGPQ
jgi:hypothetical protein